MIKRKKNINFVNNYLQSEVRIENHTIIVHIPIHVDILFI